MNYEKEKLAIWEWYENKTRAYLEAPIENGWRDSCATTQLRKNTEEFNRRLDALEAKYDMK